MMVLAQRETSPQWRPFGEIETEFLEQTVVEVKIPDHLQEFTSVEKAIDPDAYVIGPGDLLGISIITGENMTFILRVSPTGDLLIPGVGIHNVAGLSLSETIARTEDFVREQAYRNSEVDVILVDIRRFKLLTTGAVREPGFVTISPTDRLTDAIDEAGGLHKYADEESIRVVRADGTTEHFSLRPFLLEGDLGSNPTLLEGDRIEVPFREEFRNDVEASVTYNESAVLVTGFVVRPGPYHYFPGYTVRDYVGLAGGVEERGSIRSIDVNRPDQVVDVKYDDLAEPGDIIYVPQNIRYFLFGPSSMFQVAGVVLGVVFTYQRLLDLLSSS